MIARCKNCNYYDSYYNRPKRCNHPYIEPNPFGFDMPEEIDCDGFENVTNSHESIVDLVIHEDIELFIFGGR